MFLSISAEIMTTSMVAILKIHSIGIYNNFSVYVHLYKQKQVTLHVHLANRNITQDPTVIRNPRWKIKITQLECPGPQNFFTKHKSFNAQTDFKLLGKWKLNKFAK